MMKVDTTLTTEMSMNSSHIRELEAPEKIEEETILQEPPMYIATKKLGDGSQAKVYRAYA